MKVECLRLLSTLKLAPARSQLIGRFIESYLVLSAAEMKQYEREIGKLTPKEKKTTMGMVTSWRQEGLTQGKQEGITQGKEEVVVRQLRKRFGMVSERATTQIKTLSSEQLNDLAVVVLDFSGPADLEQWLAQNQGQLGK